MPARESRIPASSSTMRILCMLGSGRSFRDNGKFDNETRADWAVLFYADRAMMIFDDAAHNRQAEARAALLSGEIRQEKPLLEFASDAVPGVGDGDLDGIASRHQGSRNFNFAHHRILRRLGRVVHQIGYGALDCLAVGHYF